VLIDYGVSLSTATSWEGVKKFVLGVTIPVIAWWFGADLDLGR
jgi:hypothetical protein